MKNSMKTGILLIGLLLTFTDCEKEETQIYHDQGNMLDKQYKVPKLKDVQSKFEISNDNINPFNNQLTGFSEKRSDSNFIVDWENSKWINFKKTENIDILYTPILFNHKERMKSFLASIEKNGNIESRIFTIFYDDSSTNESFSGYIFKHDINGNFLELYKYTDGKKELEAAKKSTNKSLNKDENSKSSDCGDLTVGDVTWIVNNGGIESLMNMLDCVTVNGVLSNDGSGGGASSGSWSNPDSNLSGGSIPLGGGGTSGGSLSGSGGTSSGSTSTSESSSTTTNQPASIGDIDWWNEQASTIDVINVSSNTLIEALPNLNANQISWIKNFNNYNAVIQLINFINTNGNNTETQNSAKKILEALMLDIPVIFDIEKNNIYQGNPLNFNTLTPEQKVAVVVYALKKAVHDNTVHYFDIHQLFYNLPTVAVDVVAKIPIGGKLLDVRITFGVYNNLQINDFPNNGRQLSAAGMVGNYNVTGYWWTLYFRSYEPANNYSADALWVSVKQKGQYDFENGYYFESYLGY